MQIKKNEASLCKKKSVACRNERSIHEKSKEELSSHPLSDN
jgi:hypothetical protein